MTAKSSISSLLKVRTRLAVSPILISSKVRFSIMSMISVLAFFPVLARVRYYDCKTYVPGASPSCGYPQSGAPVDGGITRPLDRSASQACQVGHQDPSCEGVFANQVSGSMERVS